MQFPQNTQDFPVVTESATQPTLSVTGRAHLGAYEITPGARSLTISAQSGATLATSVKQTSDGSAVTVTGSTSTTPSWTAANDEAYQVTVTATLDGLTSVVAFTEADEYTAGSASDVEILWRDFTSVATGSGITSGTHTITTTEGDIGVTVAPFSGNNSTLTPTNGVGLVWSGGISGASTTTAALNWVAELASTWDAEYASHGMVTVHLYLTSIVFGGSAEGFLCGISDDTAHNSTEARTLMVTENSSVSTDEDRKARTGTGTTNLSPLTRTKVAQRVISTLLTAAEMVEIMDTSGATAPTPVSGGSSTYMIGADQINRLDATRNYGTNAYAIAAKTGQTTYAIAGLRVTRRQ